MAAALRKLFRQVWIVDVPLEELVCDELLHSDETHPALNQCDDCRVELWSKRSEYWVTLM